VHKEGTLTSSPSAPRSARLEQPNRVDGDGPALTPEDTMIGGITQDIFVEMKPNSVPGGANETDKEPDRQKKGDADFEEATVAVCNDKETPLGPCPVAISNDVAAI